MSSDFGKAPKKTKASVVDIAKIKSNPNKIVNKISGRTYAMQAIIDGGGDIVCKLVKNDKIDMLATDKLGRSLIHYAVLSKNKDLVNLLLEKNIDINLRSKDGLTPINLLFSDSTIQKKFNNLRDVDYQKEDKIEDNKAEADIKFLEWLIKKGADVNIGDRKGNLPLHMAAKNSGVSTISFLLKNTEQIDKANHKGIKAIHIAAEHNSLAVLRKIIHHRVDIRATDNKKRNVLHYALSNKDERVIDFLISETDAVKLLNDKDIEYERTALHQAIIHNRAAIVPKMAKSGADVNSKDIQGETPLDIAVSYRFYHIVRMLLDFGADVDGSNALYNSIYPYDDDIKTFNLIMEHHLDVDVTDKDGNTILMRAFQFGKNEIIETLLESGADINKLNNEKENILFFVDSQCSDEILKKVIKKGVNLNQKSSKGYTPLHKAVFANRSEKHVKLLVEAGADVNILDNQNRTPLHHLLTYDKNSAILAEWLIDKGADINLKTNDDVTVLHMVSSIDDAHRSLLPRVIKDSSIDINAVDDRGSTPLFYAVQDGCVQNIKLLLEHGANPDIMNDYGSSPRILSKYHYNQDIMKLFKDYDKKINSKKSKNPRPPKRGGGFSL